MSMRPDSSSYQRIEDAARSVLAYRRFTHAEIAEALRRIADEIEAEG